MLHAEQQNKTLSSKMGDRELAAELLFFFSISRWQCVALQQLAIRHINIVKAVNLQFNL